MITVNGSPLITHPNWLNNETGSGLIIMNEINSMNIKLKCIGSGNLIIKLRAMDLKDNSGKRIPIYLNYNKFLINDEEIISDDEIIVWYDNPFIYNKKINDGEIINIVISYVPY